MQSSCSSTSAYHAWLVVWEMQLSRRFTFWRKGLHHDTHFQREPAYADPARGCAALPLGRSFAAGAGTHTYKGSIVSTQYGPI